MEVGIVRNQVNCPHCGLPAAEYLTSDHTNESATLTVKHPEDGRVCSGRRFALDIHIFENTATAEREPGRHRWGPESFWATLCDLRIFPWTVCGYSFALYLRGPLATGSLKCLYGSVLPQRRSELTVFTIPAGPMA
jgi:hypothetical protein